MLKPNQLGKIPKGLIETYQALEDFIIEDISRRIAKAGVTDTAKWQMIRAQEFGMANQTLNKKIAAVLKISEKQVSKIFKDAAIESLDQDNVLYEQAKLTAFHIETSPELKAYMSAAIVQTKGTMKNMCHSLGFVQDVGNKKIAKSLSKSYISALDLANMQVSSGVLDYQTAVRQAVKKLASSGVNFIDYESGWHNRIDVAVRRAVISGVNQMATQMTNYTMDANIPKDEQYAEVTAHMGARPSHRDWQGQVYKVEGSTSEYANLEEATGLGSVDGLCGANCRHSYFPFIPNISVRAYTEKSLREIDGEPKKYNGKQYTAYQASHEQRKLERQIKQSKREIIGYKAAGLEEDFTNASIKLQMQKSEYNKFSNAMGIRQKKERQQVNEYGRSIAQKSAWVNKKEIEKYSQINYNKDGTIKITDDWKDKKHVKIEKEYKSYAVIETKEVKGDKVQINRTIYDSNGIMVKQIHSGPHGNAKHHPYGNHGEHKHEYKWDDNGKLLSRATSELTEKERKENIDILKEVI